MRIRFDKRVKRLRIMAAGMLAGMTLLILISVMAICAGFMDKGQYMDIPKEPEPEVVENLTVINSVTVLMIFSDESEAEPYAGHGITLSEWKDVPEWEIPQEYADTGGCLPESVQTYLYNLCRESNISYPLMLALIETESGYKWDATSPDGDCKGYAMINEQWHKDRMSRHGVTDIYNPYGNLEVSVDFLSELFRKYHDVGIVLMCYNCGEKMAMELVADGIYGTQYSEKILEREVEISHEIYGH